MTHRVLALVTDAFGGRGGVALYGRHMLRAVCHHPDVTEVVALPRKISYELEAMPPNLRYEVGAAGGKLRYGAAVISLANKIDSAGLVLCGHLNLLPFARMLGRRFRCPVLPLVYGRDAWQPTRHWIVNRLCRQIRAFVSIRKLTANRLMEWANIPDATFYYLPNCIDTAAYGVAPRRADLVAKYGLAGRTVIMTTGRMEFRNVEPNKGFDEVLETLSSLALDIPDVVYVIMGDGDGKPDLEEKARTLGVADRVVFTGYVPEKDKADHYRLADVVAMPGSSPNFDRYPFRFAFLEPLACGVPVVGSRLVDPSEKDDPDAKQLVVQVEPCDRDDIRRGILEALARRGRGIDPLLLKFSYPEFERNVFAILSDVLNRA